MGDIEVNISATNDRRYTGFMLFSYVFAFRLRRLTQVGKTGLHSVSKLGIVRLLLKCHHTSCYRVR